MIGYLFNQERLEFLERKWPERIVFIFDCFDVSDVGEALQDMGELLVVDATVFEEDSVYYSVVPESTCCSQAFAVAGT